MAEKHAILEKKREEKKIAKQVQLKHGHMYL